MAFALVTGDEFGLEPTSESSEFLLMLSTIEDFFKLLRFVFVFEVDDSSALTAARIFLPFLDDDDDGGAGFWPNLADMTELDCIARLF